MERLLTSSNFSAPDRRLGNDQISGESKVFTAHKEMMMENKRSPCYLDQGNNITSLSTKRNKADHPSVPVKDRKEKFGERIVLLQQLVSPYGKTDTASVLLEAMEYIHFLHDQVKVLSAPYLQTTPPPRMQGFDEYSLRSRGLCVVPVYLTASVASSNGADLWAPTKTTNPISQLH